MAIEAEGRCRGSEEEGAQKDPQPGHAWANLLNDPVNHLKESASKIRYWSMSTRVDLHKWYQAAEASFKGRG